MSRLTPLRRAPVLLALLLLLAGAGATRGATWWNNDWSIRQPVTLDTTAGGVPIAESIGTTPVLLRLHPGNFQFAGGREDGADLRVIAEDQKTPLAFHIEKYDPLMGEAFVWVKVPDLKPRAKTTFWLYHGNGSGKLERAEDAKGTYDADTVLVYHFTERGTPAVDATGSGNRSQNAAIPADGSFIGPGIRLDDRTVLTIPASPALQWAAGAPVTISAWIKLAALPANSVFLSRREGETNVVLGAENGAPYVEITVDGNAQRSAPVTPLTIGTWHHLALVATGTTITLYLDGEHVTSLQAALPALNTALELGGEGFSGEVDELQLAKTARPPGFIKLAAISQGDKATKLVQVGAAEQTHSWLSGGYVGVIIQSLTFDGWVVIGILALMSLISWGVMIGKATYLNQVDRGNALFMKAWHEIASDLAILGHADVEHVKTLGGRLDAKSLGTARRGSIYRIYGIGAEELRQRLARDAQRGGNKALSAQSVQAIRATLDGGLVRETQKLNRLMVLLTIAISGGPFLGLLGTVVGVMITFAAIAQEGEVNVNGIAPGISAALAATVAGLAVAIPALFGYNYLLSRVKDATSDMHVFIDEFVTKMAESFSGDTDDEILSEVLTEK